MGTIRDIPSNVKCQVVYQESRGNTGSETRTTADGNASAFDARGYSKRALAIVCVHSSSTDATSADSVTVSIYKCVDASEGGTPVLLTAGTAIAGTGAALITTQEIALDLETLGDTSGTPYRYLYASAVYVDGGSTADFEVTVVIVADAHYAKPV